MVKSEGIKLPEDKVIRSVRDDEEYKYLGILQAAQILETKLSGQNVIKAINTWAIALLIYSAAFLDWTKDEKQQLDRTRKLLTRDNTRKVM